VSEIDRSEAEENIRPEQHEGSWISSASYLRGLKFSQENEIVRANMKKGECKGDHQGHLCVLASNDRIDEIKELTRNPEYICFNCGRVADCDDNLCNPMSLKD
jgi:hypothetical protein